MAKLKPEKLKLEEILFEVGTLTIRPGDFLVLRTELHLDKDQVAWIRDQATKQFHDLGVKVVVITSGFELAVLRKEIAEELVRGQTTEKNPGQEIGR